MDGKAIIVYFGGEARELWASDGLHVTYERRLAVQACRGDSGVWRAIAPDPERSGNVKQDYSIALKERELASRLNSGLVTPLTAAYFRASATAAEAVVLCENNIYRLPEFLPDELSGDPSAIILPELLRILLDERRLSWADGISIISHCFSYRAGCCSRHPVSAIAALQPRDARLIAAVNDKLCESLWRTFPGDWQRIGSGAVISDCEVDFGKLSAVMCGRIICSKAQLTDEFRTLYVAMPNKFEDNV